MSAAHPSSSHVGVALRNLLRLGGSLGLTLLIGFVVRPLLRRWLGPDSFGPLDAADGFTAVAFIVLTLGVDSYILKEIPTRPRHANDFFASIVLVRLALAVPIFFAMQWVMLATDRSPLMVSLVWILGGTQLVMTFSSTFTVLLQANTTVDGLSALNVATKILWAGGAVAGVAMGHGIQAVAVALLVSEALKAFVGWLLCRKHLDLAFARPGWAPTRIIVLATLPYFLNTVFHTVYNKADVFLLSVFAGARSDLEAGWYGSAVALGGMTMMFVPLLFGVMMPMLARARAKDPDEYHALIRRSLELILTGAIPISLALVLGADVVIDLLFGAAYLPAAPALRLLAPVYLFIYVSIVTGLVLQLEDRAWTLALLSGAALVLNLVGNAVLISPMLVALGPSGGGVACALVQLITEAAVTAVMLWMVGRRAFDRRTGAMMLKSAAVCLAVAAIDLGLRRWAPGLPGMARLTFDGACFALGVLATGAVRIGELKSQARQLFRPKTDALKA